MRIVKDILECETLWNKYSPHKTLWDEWGVVYSFFNKKLHEPYFIVADGLLPLWLDKTNMIYYFFGGGYPEDITFWFDIDIFPEIISNIPGSIRIFDINKRAADEVIERYPEYAQYFISRENHYILNLEKFGYDINQYLQTFTRKHRKNLLYDLKRLDNFEIAVRQGGMDGFDEFIRFNNERFGEESDFFDRDFVEAVRSLFSHLDKEGLLVSTSISDRQKLVAIEYSVDFKDVFYVINGGYDLSIKNLGKLLMFTQIKEAINRKKRLVDFLSGEPGCWKELWNLEILPYPNFEKKI